ncbi:MAG: hypothetical protein SF123_23520 [Chloroflexota bacterium]|nr:hypothetical protein [Chloroflexota bacterium]
MVTLLMHIAGREAFKVEVDELPAPTDSCVVCKNPRERTDKEVNWIEDGVSTLIFPMSQIVFIEVLPSEEEVDAFPLPFRND